MKNRHSGEIVRLQGGTESVEKSELSEISLAIRNHHSAACGDPPIVNEEGRETNIGYFEIQHFKQRIFRGTVQLAKPF